MTFTFTSVVLLHPGGPYKRIPFAGLRPNRRYVSLYIRGHSTACLIFY